MSPRTAAAVLASVLMLSFVRCAGADDEMFDVTLEVVDDVSGLDAHYLVLEDEAVDAGAQSSD
jgi:hypothetical protein